MHHFRLVETAHASSLVHYERPRSVRRRMSGMTPLETTNREQQDIVKGRTGRAMRAYRSATDCIWSVLEFDPSWSFEICPPEILRRTEEDHALRPLLERCSARASDPNWTR